MNRFSSIFIIIAGIFWGSMGLFVRSFTALGFTAFQIAAIRLSVAAVVMFFLLFFKREWMKISVKDFPLLASIGLFSIGAMSILYFTTIRLTTMSVAAILLYLSPIVVMVLSVIFLKEKLTAYKLIPLTLAVLGCILVSGLGDAKQVGVLGVLTGIGSAVAYGLYSILGNIALKKYHPFTVTLWAFATAGFVLLVICNPMELVHTATTVETPLSFWALVVGIGVVTAVIPFVLYTVGLRGTQPSKAAVLACSEPVAATGFGMLVYGEFPDWISYCGIVLVLIAIVMLSGIFQKKKN